MEKDWNAYAKKELTAEPTGSGMLNGRTFAVKDVFAVAGHASGAGNPDWLRTHKPAERNAAVIDRLLHSGARLRGATMTDELMYSLNGENAHYGTPVNPKAPGRIPGGSSSGSAVAAAAGLADFAIGTDTGGSIRVPSAYCGVYGIRPTHGAVDAAGLIPLAPSFDTVGWMAGDARTLLEVGRVLLDGRREGQREGADDGPFTRIAVASDVWDLADDHSKEALMAAMPRLLASTDRAERTVLAPEGLGEWANAFRLLQACEIWREHGDWIARERPAFGPGIAERFAWAATVKGEQLGEASAKRDEAKARMELLLDRRTVLAVPTVPGIAPLLGQSGEELERRRMQTMQMCCVAGLAGLPQVTVPLAGERGYPIGLSFIAGRGQDLKLLEWVASEADKRLKPGS
ncbi:amidase [Paenibacillus arenilitoris]|uniref:Amidase n=1 Tax=Paenibacillus arenilitoris TaxID=2772299 RepID=A0A927CL74_9BACL|nr:amidase [Paenibacillus arenilitoris]MBD2868221.1 amidase [Paenibacillus arenilitoris]